MRCGFGLAADVHIDEALGKLNMVSFYLDKMERYLDLKNLGDDGCRSVAHMFEEVGKDLGAVVIHLRAADWPRGHVNTYDAASRRARKLMDLYRSRCNCRCERRA